MSGPANRASHTNQSSLTDGTPGFLSICAILTFIFPSPHINRERSRVKCYIPSIRYNVVELSNFLNFVLRWKLIFTIKTWIYKWYFRCFLCAACLPVSLIMHVAIYELRTQWHWCLHFSMSFLQFHPTVMLVAYVNSYFIIILQIFFPISCSSRIR